MCINTEAEETVFTKVNMVIIFVIKKLTFIETKLRLETTGKWIRATLENYSRNTNKFSLDKGVSLTDLL